MVVPLAVTLLALTLQAPPAAPAGDAEAGKRIYTTDFCYACHGTEGQGGKDGVRIAPNPPAWMVFRGYVRKPVGTMPGYSAQVLSDRDLADILAYLQTIPRPPALKDIPLLDEKAR